MHTRTDRPSRLWMLALSLASLTTAWRADETGPRAVVLKATKDVAAVLADDSQTRKEQRQVVESVLARNLDVEAVSKRVMRKSWKKFTSEQKAEFVVRLRTYLVLNYWNSVRKADLDRIEIVADSEKRNGYWQVETTVMRKTGGKPASVNYWLRRQKLPDGEQGPWKITDIKVAGLSMVKTFGEQLRGVFRKGGAQGVLAKLGEKNRVMDQREQEKAAEED